MTITSDRAIFGRYNSSETSSEGGSWDAVLDLGLMVPAVQLRMHEGSSSPLWTILAFGFDGK